MRRKILVAFLLIALPFVVFPFGLSPFEIPKVFAAEIVIVLILLSSLSDQTLKINWQSLSIKARCSLLMLIILALIHLVYSPNLLFGSPYRLQGTFLFILLLVLSVASSDFRLTAISPRVWFASFAIFALTSIFLPLMANGRAVGTLGEPNALASAMVFLWPIAWLALPIRSRPQKKIVQLVMYAVMLFVIYLTGSRSAVIAIILQTLFILFQFKAGTMRTLICCLALLACSLALPILYTDSTVQNRKQVWQMAYLAGWISPVIGKGFGSVEQSIRSIADQYPQYHIKNQVVDSGHNIFLDVWIQGGILGLGSMIVLLSICFVSFIRSIRILEISLLIGLLTVLSFNPASVATLIAFWYCIGQGIDGKKK